MVSVRWAIGALVVGIASVASASPGAVPPDLVQLGAVTAPAYAVSVRIEGHRASRWSEVVAPRSGHCRQEDAEGLVLDSTGMRVGEFEQLTWGDIDEPRGRWRVSQAVAKTGRARWIAVPEPLFQAVLDRLPRDDRVGSARVFLGVTADRLRTSIARACTAAGVPAFSPHDLRHRRISLLHLGGVPWARIGEHMGQRNLAVTANTYTHVLVDESEIDYAALPER